MVFDHDVFLTALICGLCSLDEVAALQSMLSRPLVVGTLCGLAMHEPGAGFASGCLMELLWLGNLPVGSVVPPDFTLAASFASAGSILIHRSQPGLSWEACEFWTLLFSIPVASLGGLGDQWQRRKSAGLAAWVERRLDAGDESALFRAVALALGLAFARGFVLAMLCMAFLAPALGDWMAALPPAVRVSLEWMYWLGLLLGFAVLVDQFWEQRSLRVAGLSFVVSAVAVYGFGLRGPLLLALALGLASFLALLKGLRHRHRRELQA